MIANRTQRERRLIWFATLVVGASGLWWWGIEPALTTVREAPEAIRENTATLRLLHNQSVEIRRLKSNRAPPPLPVSQAKNLLERLPINPKAKLKTTVVGQEVRFSASGLDEKSLVEVQNAVLQQILGEVKQAKLQKRGELWQINMAVDVTPPR